MDVTVDRAELAKAVTVSAEFASKSKNFPLLNCLSITALPFQVSIDATDLESASHYSMAVNGEASPGVVMLPAYGVRDFVTSATGTTVRIRNEAGKPARLESGQSRVSMRTGPGELPIAAFGEPVAGVEIPAPKLAALFARTSFVVHRVDGLPVGDGAINELTSAGVRLISNGSLTAIAHDGHRMARCIADIASVAQFELTVPPRAAHWLSTMRWAQTDTVALEKVPAGMTLRGGPLTVFFRTTNVLMPDSSRAFAPDFEYRATFATKEFARAISAVTNFAEEGPRGGKAIEITFLPSQAKITGGSDFATAEAEEIIDCAHAAPQMTFEFVPRYLTEFAKAVPSEAVAMRFNSSGQICRFTHKGDPEFVYVVSPRYRKAK